MAVSANLTVGQLLTSNIANTYMLNSGLVYVGQTTATSGTTFDLSSCFSATYDSYKVVLSDIRTAAAGGVSLQLMNGTTPVATNYAWAFMRVAYDASTAPTASGYPATTSSWATATSTGTAATAVSIEIFNPFLAQYSYYQIGGSDTRGTSGYGFLGGGGTHTLATSYNSLRFTITGTTISNVQATIYGYRKA